MNKKNYISDIFWAFKKGITDDLVEAILNKIKTCRFGNSCAAYKK